MKKHIKYIGLDDSKDAIDVAIADEGRDGEIRKYGTISNTPDALRKMVRRLGRPKDLHFVYEAGPCGYETYRELRRLGANCMVAAPSKTPQKAGERIKTDSRDAMNLARLHRAGELTAVWVPDEVSEAMRDVTRAREDSKYQQIKARQRLGSFLLRHGRRFAGKCRWTKAHMAWIVDQRFEQPAQHVCLEEYLGTIKEADERVSRFNDQILELLEDWSLASMVSALSAHRGVSVLVATTVCAELGDITRFDKPRDLMAFVGLVPSVHATGQTRHTGAITKTGNAHVRRVLIEAAWAYRHPARRTYHIQKRLKNKPKAIQDLSWKAQSRLCRRYRQFIARGKHTNKAVTAVARELIGFLWATAQLVNLNTQET